MSLAPPASPARPSVSDVPPAAAPPPGSPSLRRLGRPRWRDGRLLAGVLLVLVSVGVGARVVSGAQQTGRWVAAARDLPAGHVLTERDITTAAARLSGAGAQRYFRAERHADLVGHPLVHAVGGGDLLPLGAVSSAAGPASRVVPVLVKAGRLPALSVGDHVDVYVLDRAPATGPPVGNAAAAQASAGAAASAAGQELLVLADVEYLGGAALGSGDTSVQLRVPPSSAAPAVAASQSERVDLARVDAGSGGDRGAGLRSVPGYGS